MKRTRFVDHCGCDSDSITYLGMQLYVIHLIMQSVCGENTDRKIDGFIYI